MTSQIPLIPLFETFLLYKIRTGHNCHKACYYSFKIFLLFWLAYIPRIIHHYQLLSTKFGRILRCVKSAVNCAANLADYWTLNWEDLGTRLSSVLVVSTKWWDISFVSRGSIGELLAKNIARTDNSKLTKTTRRTTSAIWRAFAVLNNRLSPKRVYKQAIEDVLNIDGGKHDLACL